MTENFNSIFNESDCLSEEQLLGYLNRTLNSSAQHRVEKHLLECEFCSDALEGLQAHPNKENIADQLEELNERVDQYSKVKPEETKIKVLFPWQIAAAFALLLVSGIILWLFLPKNNSDQLFTQEYKPFPVKENKVEPVIPKTDSVVPVTLSAPIKVETKVKPQVVSVTQEKTIAKREVAETKKSESEQTVVAEADNFSQTRDMKQVPAAAPHVASADAMKDEAKPNIMAMKEMNPATTGPVVVTDTTSEFEMGLNAYKAGKYNDAITILDKIKNTESLFYSGVSYLSIGKPEEAISRFESFHKAGTNDLSEASWWYEALAYLKLDKKAAAKNCLNHVISFNGPYAAKAKQLSDKL